EGKRQRRRDALLFALLTEASGSIAGCVANLLGIHRTGCERLYDGVGYAVDLGVGDAKLTRDGPLAVAGVPPDLAGRRKLPSGHARFVHGTSTPAFRKRGWHSAGIRHRVAARAGRWRTCRR